MDYPPLFIVILVGQIEINAACGRRVHVPFARMCSGIAPKPHAIIATTMNIRGFVRPQENLELALVLGRAETAMRITFPVARLLDVHKPIPCFGVFQVHPVLVAKGRFLFTGSRRRVDRCGIEESNEKRRQSRCRHREGQPH